MWGRFLLDRSMVKSGLGRLVRAQVGHRRRYPRHHAASVTRHHASNLQSTSIDARQEMLSFVLYYKRRLLASLLLLMEVRIYYCTVVRVLSTRVVLCLLRTCCVCTYNVLISFVWSRPWVIFKACLWSSVRSCRFHWKQPSPKCKGADDNVTYVFYYRPDVCSLQPTAPNISYYNIKEFSKYYVRTT